MGDGTAKRHDTLGQSRYAGLAWNCAARTVTLCQKLEGEIKAVDFIRDPNNEENVLMEREGQRGG